MDWLATILTSSNAVSLVILSIVIILILAFLVRAGLVKFKSDKLSIGYQDKERTIIRQQIEFAENACMSFILAKDIPTDCDKYRIRFVNEKLYDEMIKWISFNHITKDDTYVEIKQNIIWGLINTYTDKDFFKTEEMHEIVNAEVKRIIYKLVDIRRYYSK